VLLALEHLADDEALSRRWPDRLEPLDLGPGHHQPVGELGRAHPRVAVLAQP
jgi:hypothetical protein